MSFLKKQNIVSILGRQFLYAKEHKIPKRFSVPQCQGWFPTIFSVSQSSSCVFITQSALDKNNNHNKPHVYKFQYNISFHKLCINKWQKIQAQDDNSATHQCQDFGQISSPLWSSISSCSLSKQ